LEIVFTSLKAGADFNPNFQVGDQNNDREKPGSSTPAQN
jgi:hypothetical protein